MATEVRLPHLGESIDSALLVAWHKQVGDTVKRGDELADLETDKATLPLEAPKNGVLLAIVAEEGQMVYIGDLLSVIGRDGETWSDSPKNNRQNSTSISTVKTTVSIPARTRLACPPSKYRPLRAEKPKHWVSIWPLVNPPQSAILGVAAPRNVLIPGEDAVAKPAQLLALTVACDHRVLDGADAAAFLRDLKAAFESFHIEP